MKELNKLVAKINERIFNAISERRIQKMQDEVETFYDRLSDFIAQRKFHELESELVKTEKLLQAVRTTLETEEENISFQIGRLAGINMVFKQMYFDNAQVTEARALCPDTKYADILIDTLADVPFMQHKQLADKLDISSSQLTQIMAKLDKSSFKFINSSKNGKFKYYSLSEIGKKYYKKQIGRNVRDELLQLMRVIYLRLREKKNSTITEYICKYYDENLELKEEAFKIECALDRRENYLRGLPYYSWALANTALKTPLPLSEINSAEIDKTKWLKYFSEDSQKAESEVIVSGFPDKNTFSGNGAAVPRAKADFAKSNYSFGKEIAYI